MTPALGRLRAVERRLRSDGAIELADDLGGLLAGLLAERVALVTSREHWRESQRQAHAARDEAVQGCFRLRAERDAVEDERDALARQVQQLRTGVDQALALCDEWNGRPGSVLGSRVRTALTQHTRSGT